MNWLKVLGIILITSAVFHINWGLSERLRMSGFCGALVEVAKNYRTQEEISQVKEDEEFQELCRGRYSNFRLMSDIAMAGFGLYLLWKGKKEEPKT